MWFRYCPPGTGYLQCDDGQWSAGGNVQQCTDCPAGRYGRPGLSAGLATSQCSGPCSAGYGCPARSTSPTPALSICDRGSYSLSGRGACTMCPAGSFGATTGLTTALCSGLCGVGKFSADGSQQCSTCQASPGSYCPAGSTDQASTGIPCDPGSYSAGGAASCYVCPVGRYSDPTSNGCQDCRCALWYACTAPANGSRAMNSVPCHT